MIVFYFPFTLRHDNEVTIQIIGLTFRVFFSAALVFTVEEQLIENAVSVIGHVYTSSRSQIIQ